MFCFFFFAIFPLPLNFAPVFVSCLRRKKPSLVYNHHMETPKALIGRLVVYNWLSLRHHLGLTNEIETEM